ncbi:MAG: L,D-transpeptidase family protein [Candidatus Sumerlaeia bacterium]
MASVRRTLSTILILIIVAAIAAGGVIGYGYYQRWSMGRQFTAVRQLVTDKKFQEAETQLAALEGRAQPGQSWLADWVDLRLQALEGINDQESAAQWAAKALNPDKAWVQQGDDGWVRAHLILGRRAVNQEQLDAAREHFNALASLAPDQFGHTEGQLGLGWVDLATPGKVQEGRDRLAALLDTLRNDHAMRADVEAALGRANLFLLMSPEPHEGDEIYAIQKGDSMDRLRRKYKVSADLLMRVNRITNPQALSIGHRIKIPKLELSILVNKSDNTLTLYNHGKFFKKYDVRTGQYEYMTPPGEYTIQRKVVDPPWTDPKTGARLGPGDPNNQLGCRWMEISGSIGIHEAIDPNTIGTYSSNGCVGLVKDDVIELYDLVSVGTPVKIIGARGATGAALSATDLTAPARRGTGASAPPAGMQQAPAAAPAAPQPPAMTPAGRSSIPVPARPERSRSRNHAQEGTRR